MTSKTSSSNQTATAKKTLASRRFGISTALVKEDFRRFWAIPVIAFIGYFLSGIFYILVNYDSLTSAKGSYMAGFVENMLEGQYWAFTINMLWVPVLSSVLIFRYLHKTGHVMSAHSQPFSRSTVLNSHAASCALFCIIPIIATSLVLFMIAKPVYYPADSYTSKEFIVNVFARTRILNWAWDSILTSMFALVICIIGGLATGTSFHHAVAACGFNVVLPASLFFLTTYSEVYLFGYTDSNYITDMAARSHLAILNACQGFLTMGQSIAYIFVIAVLFVLCHFMYSKRKLERATDGVVFKAFDVGITLVFGYLGMTMLGLAFYSIFDESMVITAVGYIAGALLGMIICRMIILKSIKVLNKGTFRMLAVYLIIGLLFIGCFGMDMTGFENRIPASADGVSLEIDSEILGVTDYYALAKVYEDPETIDAVKNLHQLVIDNKKEIENRSGKRGETPDDSMWYVSDDSVHFYITYYSGTKENSVQIIRRAYSVPADLLLNSDELGAFVQCSEYRKAVADYVPDAENIVNIDIHGGEYMTSAEDGISLTDKALVAGFIDAYEKDLNSVDMEHIRTAYNKPALAHVDISYRDTSNERHMNEPTPSELAEITGEYGSVTTQALTDYGYYASADLLITPAHDNTIRWLRDNGYGSLVQFDQSSFNFAVIHKIEGGVNGADTYDAVPVSDDMMTVVTDKEKIESYYGSSRAHEVFDAFRNISSSEDDIYCVMFYKEAFDEKGIVYEYELYYTAYIEGKYI